MTDWSTVEFATTTYKSRKAHDFLPILSDLLVGWDFLACMAAGQAALAFYLKYMMSRPLDMFTSGPIQRDIILGSLISAFILKDSKGLQDRKMGSISRFILNSERRCCIALVVLIAVEAATCSTEGLARLWLVLWFALFSIAVAATRSLFGLYLRKLHGNGDLRESIAIVGSEYARDRLAARIGREANVVGMFSLSTADGGLEQEADDLDDLLDLGREGGVDSVILALGQGQHVDIPHILKQLKALPVQVAVCPEDGWSSDAAPHMRLLGGLTMEVVSDRPLKQWDLLIKMVFDKIGASMLLVLLAPLLLALALAVGNTSSGPIIFRQKRQGWCGRDFTVLKFRTMRVDASGLQCGSQRAVQTSRGDVRCTRVGRALRSFSLDELPQLWNVMRGEMSLVGPRPHADSLHDIDQAGQEIVAEYAQRNRVRPGMTGWAQVNGARGATATLDQLRRRVEYDLYYIENWSFWLDLRILLRTPFCMAGENAF